jgi:hypothetical protein
MANLYPHKKSASSTDRKVRRRRTIIQLSLLTGNVKILLIYIYMVVDICYFVIFHVLLVCIYPLHDICATCAFHYSKFMKKKFMRAQNCKLFC